MVNFQDTVWPSDYKNQGPLVLLAQCIKSTTMQRFLSACVSFLDNRVRLSKISLAQVGSSHAMATNEGRLVITIGS